AVHLVLLSEMSSFLPPTGLLICSFFFFFIDTATTAIYTLSLHDALPICNGRRPQTCPASRAITCCLTGSRIRFPDLNRANGCWRSEEHTSELQSPYDLVCRLLLEKKKT